MELEKPIKYEIYKNIEFNFDQLKYEHPEDIPEDELKSKYRSVLFIGSFTAYNKLSHKEEKYYLAAEITSKASEKRGYGFWGDWDLLGDDWRDCGLLKPSTVRFNHLMIYDEENLNKIFTKDKYVGTLPQRLAPRAKKYTEQAKSNCKDWHYILNLNDYRDKLPKEFFNTNTFKTTDTEKLFQNWTLQDVKKVIADKIGLKPENIRLKKYHTKFLKEIAWNKNSNNKDGKDSLCIVEYSPKDIDIVGNTKTQEELRTDIREIEKEIQTLNIYIDDYNKIAGKAKESLAKMSDDEIKDYLHACDVKNGKYIFNIGIVLDDLENFNHDYVFNYDDDFRSINNIRTLGEQRIANFRKNNCEPIELRIRELTKEKDNLRRHLQFLIDKSNIKENYYQNYTDSLIEEYLDYFEKSLSKGQSQK